MPLRLDWLAFLPVPVLLPACVIPQHVGGLTGTPYVLELSWEGQTENDADPIPYVVFEERCQITSGMPHTPTFSHFMGAHLWSGESQVIDDAVPPDTALMVLNPIVFLTFGTSTTYRLTIFCPGYRAETVDPMGAYGSRFSPARLEEVGPGPRRFSGPCLLDGRFQGDAVTHGDANIPLGWTEDEKGAYHSKLPLRSVTSETIYEDVIPNYRSLHYIVHANHPETPVSGGARDLFEFQIHTLAHAIAKGRLNRADKKTRTMVLDAIRQQHDAMAEQVSRDSFLTRLAEGELHRGSFDTCVHREGSPCGVVLKWARELDKEDRVK